MDAFEKWFKEINGDKLAKDVDEIAENGGGEYKEVPHGEYIVTIDKLEVKQARSGRQMLSAWMKIVEGEYRGSFIFMNQVIEKPFQIHLALQFLRSLDTGAEVAFTENFPNMLSDIYNMTVKAKLEYKLEYGQNKGGYNTFKITEVYG